MSTLAASHAISAPSSQLTRVGKLFYAPGELGQDIRRNRSWWLPYLITILLVYGLSIAAARRVGFEQLTFNIMRAEGISDPLNSDPAGTNQVGANFRNTVTVLQVSTYAAPLVILIYNTVYALALQMAFRLLAGVKANFNLIFTILVYCDLIQDVRTILSTIVLYLDTEPNNYNLQNPVGTNFGYFFKVGYAPWVRVIFEAADIVTIWYLLVIAFGCAVALNVDKKMSYSLVFGLWLMVVTVRTLWAVII